MNIIHAARNTALIGAFALVLPVSVHAAPSTELVSERPKQTAPGRYSRRAAEMNVDTRVLSRGDRAIKLYLPDGTPIEIDRARFRNRGKGDAMWQGRVRGESDSSVTLTVKKGRMAGRIRIDDDVYRIRPKKGGGPAKGKRRRHVLEEVDSSSFPGCQSEEHQHHFAVPVSEDEFAPSIPLAAPAEDGSIVTIDLLSVYTAAARIKAGGVAEIEADIQAAVDVANTAFIESNMSIRYTLLHTAEVYFDDSAASTSDALYWVDDDPEVSYLRELYGADMVSIIVDTPSSCGTAWVQRNPGSFFQNSAFQATDIDCAVGNMTLAHEHGHNLGFEHNPEDSSVGSNPGAASYPWSFAHWISGSYRTVMSYSSPCGSWCPRVARFSNPLVSYASEATGIVDQRENARTGDLTGPIVAEFRDRPIPGRVELEVRVSSTWDDVEENETNGNMVSNSADLEFGYDAWGGALSEQYLGLRFPSVNIPQGATVLEAYLVFSADEVGTGPASATIYAMASDDAAAFTSTPYDVSTRTKTSTSVSWTDIPEWTSVFDVHQSPDLAALVQEVVNRGGWTAGSALAFMLDGEGERIADAYDGSTPYYAPLLYVAYDEASTGNTSPSAHAGADQFVADSDLLDGESVTLDGSASTDPDGTVDSYDWDWPGGSATGMSPTVNLPNGDTVITLTVTDDDGATSTDVVRVIVELPPPNADPVADAGPDQLVADSDDIAGESVNLNGTGSTDSDGTLVSYDWSWSGGSANGATPAVSLPDGTTVITLTVTDNLGGTDSDTVSVTVDAPEEPPGC